MGRKNQTRRKTKPLPKIEERFKLKKDSMKQIYERKERERDENRHIERERDRDENKYIERERGREREREGEREREKEGKRVGETLKDKER